MKQPGELMTLTRTPYQDSSGKVPEGCRIGGAEKFFRSGLFMDADLHNCEGLVVGRRRIARNASLYREGDRLGALFSVRFGQFKMMRQNSMGVLCVAEFYMAGDLIGFDGIATGRHNFRLAALEDSEVWEISYPAMLKTMAINPNIQHRLLQSMSAALNVLHDHSSVLSKPSLDARFAGFLLSLGAKNERLGYSGKSFRLGMSRGEIGTYLGTTLESVSRLISRFNAQNAVTIKGRTVEIHDSACLTALL